MLYGDLNHCPMNSCTLLQGTRGMDYAVAAFQSFLLEMFNWLASVRNSEFQSGDGLCFPPPDKEHATTQNLWKIQKYTCYRSSSDNFLDRRFSIRCSPIPPHQSAALRSFRKSTSHLKAVVSRTFGRWIC